MVLNALHYLFRFSRTRSTSFYRVLSVRRIIYDDAAKRSVGFLVWNHRPGHRSLRSGEPKGGASRRGIDSDLNGRSGFAPTAKPAMRSKWTSHPLAKLKVAGDEKRLAVDIGRSRKIQLCNGRCFSIEIIFAAPMPKGDLTQSPHKGLWRHLGYIASEDRGSARKPWKLLVQALRLDCRVSVSRHFCFHVRDLVTELPKHIASLPSAVSWRGSCVVTFCTLRSGHFLVLTVVFLRREKTSSRILCDHGYLPLPPNFSTPTPKILGRLLVSKSDIFSEFRAKLRYIYRQHFKTSA